MPPAKHNEETPSLRFGDYINEVTVRAEQISYRHLMPKPRLDAAGRVIPFEPTKLKLQSIDVYRLLQPYLSRRFIDQARAVVPLALYLALFQVLVLRTKVAEALPITGGLLAVVLGLMFFMEGLKLGLMPLGEILGNTLPRRVRLPAVLAIAFILGVGVTFAEPAIGALQVAGSLVDPAKAPYLFTLLNDRAGMTVLVVGAGVGIAAVLGTLRFIHGWSLKPLIYLSLLPTLLLSLAYHFHPDLAAIVGLAWDCGGVTTGPVTVPLVLALGIGVASAVGKGDSTLSGFGIVTLASVFPILGVLLLGGILSLSVSPAAIAEAAGVAARAAADLPTPWHATSPWVEILLGLRAIIPLVIFLLLVLWGVLRQKLPNAGMIAYGIVLANVGMCVFNIGLTYGLSKLGGQSGGLVPGAFAKITAMAESPLYAPLLGIGLAGLFAWVLGFGATMAEPALGALGLTVENLTSGAFRKQLLVSAVAVGVGAGILLGVLKIIYDLPLLYILLPAYAGALVLTHFSTEAFVNVAWDSAGVTTGPVTVPLVLAMGLGFGQAVGAVDGFGILAAASVCPILSVLALGLVVQARERRHARAVARPPVFERN